MAVCLDDAQVIINERELALPLRIESNPVERVAVVDCKVNLSVGNGQRLPFYAISDEGRFDDWLRADRHSR